MTDNNVPKAQSAAQFTHALFIIATFDPTLQNWDGNQKQVFNHKSNKTCQDVAEK